MIVEDPFPQVTSVNIVVTDLRAILNAKNDGRFFSKCQDKKDNDSKAISDSQG